MAVLHVVFDIDGTLTDNRAAVQVALRSTAETLLGHEAAQAELDLIFTMPTDAVLLTLGFPDIGEAHRLWHDNCVEELGRAHLFPGIRSLLEALRRRGYTLGLVSSGTHQEYDTRFLPLDLGDFPTVVLAEDTPRQKPHPDPLRRYLELSGAAAGEVLYVGDAEADFLCAREAGVRFAQACWGEGSEEPEASFHLPSPDSLLELLARLEDAAPSPLAAGSC